MRFFIALFFIFPMFASASASLDFVDPIYVCDITDDNGSYAECLSMPVVAHIVTTGEFYDTVDGFGCNGDPGMTYWRFSIYLRDVNSVSEYQTFSPWFHKSVKSTYFTLDVDQGQVLRSIDIECSNLGDVNNGGANNPALFIGSGYRFITPVIPNASIASFSVIDSPTASDMIAGVGSATATNGETLWVIVAMIIAIPLAFWLLDKVTDMFPGESPHEYAMRVMREKNDTSK